MLPGDVVRIVQSPRSPLMVNPMVDTPCKASPLMNIAVTTSAFQTGIVTLDQRNTHHATLAIQSDRIILDALAELCGNRCQAH